MTTAPEIDAQVALQQAKTMKPSPGFLPRIAASAAGIFKKAGRAAGVAAENLCAGRSYAASPYLGEQGRAGQFRRKSIAAPSR
jgi:hypothetical protein